MPLKAALEKFEVELDGGWLRAKPTTHFPDASAARNDLEPQLSAWETTAMIQGRWIRFKFADAKAVDNDPTPGISHVGAGSVLLVGATASVTVSRAAYPAAHPEFELTVLAEEIAQRIRRWRENRESLMVVAYWLLSRLEDEFEGRRRAATGMRVDSKVLQKLGQITAIPDPEIGRKAKGTPAKITQEEQQWVEEVVVRLALRSGVLAQGSANSMISMSDFPLL